MKESDQNTKIRKKIEEMGGWCFKIADPPKSAIKTSVKNPFDLFGVIDEKSFYIETKIMNKLEAFNFGKIREHQFLALKKIKEINPLAICGILLCVKVSNKISYAYFEIEEIDEMLKDKKKSIPKNEIDLRLKKLEEIFPLVYLNSYS